MSSSFGLTPELVRYLADANPPEHPALVRCREETSAMTQARMQISPEQGAYMAAVDRCNHVIQHFQRTTAVRDALVTMIDAYKRLGKDDLATDAQRVLDLNDKEGKFVSDDLPPEQVTLTRKLWDYLELDKN